MSKYKDIKEYIDYFYFSSQMKMVDLIEIFNGYIEIYGASVQIENDSYWDGDLDEARTYKVFYFRKETEKEYQKRIETTTKRSKAAKEAAAKRKAKKEEQERKQYEKLRIKYEK